LLRAFADDATLGRAYNELSVHGYRTHEFGDSVLIEHFARCRHVATGPAMARA
jgi:S-adenosylmethionine:tRNA ribosyltransferase-isomerase